MLMRMESRKEVKRQEFDFGVADWFMLPKTKGLQRWAYLHQKAAADVFVAYYPHMSAWIYEPAILRDRADRGMKIFDKTVYFEVDRCTEGMKVIEEKIDNYIQFSRETGERFHVVFCIVGDEREVLNRGNNIIPILQDRMRGEQFLIANAGNIISNPLGEIFYSPKDEIKSLEMFD
jgi:hypothetical protein